MKITYESDSCLSIRDGSNSQLLTATMLISACLFTGCVFSVPLVGVVFSASSRTSDFLIAAALSGIPWILVLFVIRLIFRSMIPWEININSCNDHILIRRKLFCTLWTQKMSKQCSIVSKPAYQRGDWGYSIWIKDYDGKDLLIFRPTLVSSNIKKANDDATCKCLEISDFFGISMSLHEKWEQYSEVAFTRKHHIDG